MVIITDDSNSAKNAKATVEPDDNQLSIYENENIEVNFIYGYLEGDDFIRV